MQFFSQKRQKLRTQRIQHFKLTDQQAHDALVQIVGPDTRNDKFWDTFKKPKDQPAASAQAAPPSVPKASPPTAPAAEPVFVMPAPTPHTVFIPPGHRVALPHEAPAAPAAAAPAAAPVAAATPDAVASAKPADAAAELDADLAAEYDELFGESEEEEDEDGDDDVDGEELTSPGGGGPKPDSPTPPGSVVNAAAGSVVDNLGTLPLEPVEAVIQPIPKEDPGLDARKSLESELRAQATPVRKVSGEAG